MAYDPANGQPHWLGVPGWGWSARTLPYLEQTAVYDNLIRFDLPITDPANAAARTAVINTFRCPSNIGGPTLVLQGGGPLVGGGSFTPVALSTGNYIGAPSAPSPSTSSAFRRAPAKATVFSSCSGA